MLDKVDNSLSPRKIFDVVVGHDFNSNGPVQVWIPARDSIVHESRFDIVDPPTELVDQINAISKDDEDNHSMPLLLTQSDRDAGVVHSHVSVRYFLANRPLLTDDDEPVAPVRNVLGPPPTISSCPADIPVTRVEREPQDLQPIEQPTVIETLPVKSPEQAEATNEDCRSSIRRPNKYARGYYYTGTGGEESPLRSASSSS